MYQNMMEIFAASAAPLPEKTIDSKTISRQLITGAVQTAPVDGMDLYTQMEPLQLRREQQAIWLN